MEGTSKPFSPDSAAEIQRLELALESAGIGTWELDFNTGQVRWCHRTKALFHFSGDDIVPLEKLLEQIHHADRQLFEESLKFLNYHPSPNTLSVEIRADEKVEADTIWVSCKGQIHVDPSNNTNRFLGTFIDVTKDVLSREQVREGEKHQRGFQTIVEQAPMAIGLLKGRDFVIELGNEKIFEVWGKDSSVIGKRLIDALPEIKDQVFMEILGDVYECGEPYYGNGMLAKLIRNDSPENVYFDFVYTPMRDDDGVINGIMILATEVTRQYHAIRNLAESESKFRALIDQAPVATCLFVGKDMVVELANQPMIDYWGKDKSVIGKPLREALPELEGQPFLDILDEILTTGEAYSSKNAPVEIEVGGVMSTYYFNFTYKPIFDGEGEVYGIVNMSIDVTAQVLAQKALEESEAKLRSVVASAPAAIGLFVGRDLIVEMPNQAFIDIVGKGPDIVGIPLREVMPELNNQAFLQILDDVFTTGIMYQSFGAQVNIVQNGVMSHNYYNITYSPIFDNEGKVYAILDIAIDVTERVLAQQQVEESERQLLDLFEQSPIAIAIISKDNLTITMANPFYGEMVGRKIEEVIGKPMLEAMPELVGQGFEKLIESVMSTGIPYLSKEQPVDILRNNEIRKIYIDLTYQPQRDAENHITGVFVVATDVTQQVEARQKIEEAESSLRGAIELADLGTWQLDIVNGTLEFSERLKGWFGFEKEDTITPEQGFLPIRESDKPVMQAAMDHALKMGTDGIFDVEYRLDTGGMERIIHAQGKSFYNEKGEVYKVVGTAQDVTVQRKVKLALEQQVQERTEELEVMNEELASINEEYVATNEELAESNNLLVQSNLNLQQFAYVASHDLQEPLRKIQSFGNLLVNRYSEQLGEGVGYLSRMQSAAKRMSDLIEDLLTFSKISSKKENTQTISLSEVIHDVLTDLELVIQESAAEVTVTHLPDIQGDPTQIGQLFQNLISNALKFRKPNVNPVINIRSEIVSNNDLPLSVVPSRAASLYYKFEVSDNGIGFDQKYADRIFQLFQRLHGRSEYTGTGIGLAICDRVAANHGGTISVTSEPGRGSTFSVYLPFQ
ncbi:PAS domain-containing protein [Dyadobacter psychrotolerans]|uniref:histidine kinase n=1 Tax=Dyadobacter psychrotolerans TaxID=2541721 RepID=A0A4R5DC56_9BACT|nr:PAS domain-containing protein [Dyadobacter psychrotolerans]TDE10527.1 PAS domain S-box protein [Dyadobacter psychrotolerans]